MTNEELVLVALSGLPLDIAQLQHYTGIPWGDLWVVLTDLQERGLVATWSPRPVEPERPPLRFVRVQR